ncbi:MAG: hypothetical protein N2246_04200, partial [Candidatus Sumerlaeia bacterium]|nr:hypothetical protein [Candidatus Sumerlaeia bacterium]
MFVILLLICEVFLLIVMLGRRHSTGLRAENVNILIAISVIILFLIGLIAIFSVGLKRQRQRTALQQQYLNKPWLWR